jgi:hypothetical protein
MFTLRKYTDPTYQQGVVSGLKSVISNSTMKYSNDNKNRARRALNSLKTRGSNYTQAKAALNKIKADAELRAARKQANTEITRQYQYSGEINKFFKNAIRSAHTVNAVRNILNKSSRLSQNLKTIAEWFKPQNGYRRSYMGYRPKNNSNTTFNNNMKKLQNKYNQKTINTLNELVTAYRNIQGRAKFVR